MVPLPAHDRQGGDGRPSVSTIMSTVCIIMTRAGRVSMIAAGCAGVISAAVVSAAVVSAAVVNAAVVSVPTGKTRTPGQQQQHAETKCKPPSDCHGWK